MKITATKENLSEVLDKYGDKKGILQGIYTYNGRRVEGQHIQVQTTYKNYIDWTFKNKSNHGHVECFILEFDDEEDN